MGHSICQTVRARAKSGWELEQRARLEGLPAVMPGMGLQDWSVGGEGSQLGGDHQQLLLTRGILNCGEAESGRLLDKTSVG